MMMPKLLIRLSTEPTSPSLLNVEHVRDCDEEYDRTGNDINDLKFDGLSQGMFGNAGPYFGVTFKF